PERSDRDVASIPVVSNTAEATAMVRAGLQFLAAADATQLTAEEQARCLYALEQAAAMGTAARTSILAAFTAAQGYAADGDYSPRAWLIHRTGVTKGAAVASTAWVRRPEPAAGRRVQRDDPGGHPERGDPAGPALPVGRAVQPAALGLPG